MANLNHPTREKLIETATHLLKSLHPGEISSEMVLTESGISKGSLYHHFEDLEHLIETALLARYARWVSVNVDVMTKILTQAKSTEDIYLGLVEVTKASQDRKLKSERFFRAEVLTRANNSPRLALQLQLLQDQLTESLTDLVREAQERGFFRKSNDAKSIAVMVQAYTLGKIVDDSSNNPVDQEQYAELINSIVKNVFLEPY
jgi:AcrR family transcriptional regulator